MVINPRALEDQAIFQLRRRVHEAHGVLAAWALLIVVEKALPDHPLEAPLEIPGDAEHLEVPLEAVLHNVPLDHLSEVGLCLIVIQESLVKDLPSLGVGVLHLVILERGVLFSGRPGFQLVLEISHVLIKESDRCLVIIQGLLMLLEVVGGVT